jgi:signal transduction histidine kinase
LTHERTAFLPTQLAGVREVRFALAFVLVSAVFFTAAVPFAKIPLKPVIAFIPANQSALVICDLITAVLLFNQFNVLRLRALLVLAAGYLFTAFAALSHALSFPGLFSPTGLLGAGPQTTAWLYFFWHGGFPILVIAYALLKDKGRLALGSGCSDSSSSRGPGLAILITVSATFTAVCGLTFMASTRLPSLMAGDRFSSPLTGVVEVFWALNFLALLVLWWRRPLTSLDLWLMVVMCAWIFDMGLGAVFNTGRFDFGFYAGRMYALFAASGLLIVLLMENGRHYSRLIRDITDRKTAETVLLQRTFQLEAANLELSRFSRRLEESNRELQDFASVASHDLQEPLRKIQVFGDRLKTASGAAMDEQSRDYLNRMLNAGGRMRALIDDLLSFARVTSQASPFVTVDLGRVVREVLSDLEVRIGETGAVVEVGELPAIHADPMQMRQLLQNLIGNGLKFHKKGKKPTLRVCGDKVEDSPDSAAMWRIVVADDGIGFDEKYLDRIFAVFQRLHGRTEYEGTGIGLAICRKIAERHGGNITARSAPDQGSTFTITLPCRHAA